MESTAQGHVARLRHAKVIEDISGSALGAAQMMESIREKVDALPGYASEMKKARRRLVGALDYQIAAIYGVIDDAGDARAMLLRI